MEDKRIIGYQIRTLNQMFCKMAAAAIEKQGISQMQGWFIRYIYEHTLEKGEDVFQKDLEAFFHIARSTATGILQGMEKQGFIVRESVPSDARLKRLVLTQKGIDTHLMIIHHFDQMELVLKENISEQQMDTFFEVIHMLKENIQSNLLT